MAWPTRSKLLAIQHRTAVVSGTWYSLGGPAASHTWLCKFLTFYNGSTATRKLYLAIVRGGQRYNLMTLSAATDTVEFKDCVLVAEAGDTLEWAIAASFTNTIDVSVNGALLG